LITSVIHVYVDNKRKWKQFEEAADNVAELELLEVIKHKELKKLCTIIPA